MGNHPSLESKKETKRTGPVPFLLPHETLSDYMHRPGAKEEAMPEIGAYRSQNLARGTMVPIGNHGDGVPVPGRMNQSTLDFWTLNLPCSEAFRGERIPITCLEAKYNAGQETVAAMCAVMAWSLKKLAEGQYPCTRHDGTPFHPKKEKARNGLAGKRMPAKAALIELRADWDWNCKWFGTPQHNSKAGCCWLRAAKPEDWRGLSIQDRKEKSLQQADWIESLESRNLQPNPLFQLPGVSNWTMYPDWMHVADEGCVSLAAGQILWDLLDQYPASNQSGRAAEMWEHIQQLYEASNWLGASRLPKLNLKDIKKPGKAAELGVKAAQCRHFIPILPQLTEAHGYHVGSNHQKAVRNVAKYCAKMYAALEVGDKPAMAKNGHKFINQYLVLEQHATKKDPSDIHTWRARPKFHLLQHLLDLACKGLHPKDVWNYTEMKPLGIPYSSCGSEGVAEFSAQVWNQKKCC